MFSLATIVTSKTRLEVLELFLKNPTLELGVRETARRLNSNVMAVRNELLHLQQGGILKSRKVANSIQYSLDNSCPAVGSLRTLFEMSDRGPNPPRSAVVESANHPSRRPSKPADEKEPKNSQETREP